MHNMGSDASSHEIEAVENHPKMDISKIASRKKSRVSTTPRSSNSHSQHASRSPLHPSPSRSPATSWSTPPPCHPTLGAKESPSAPSKRRPRLGPLWPAPAVAPCEASPGWAPRRSSRRRLRGPRRRKPGAVISPFELKTGWPSWT